MFRNINWHALLFTPETHPEVKTLKQYHEDLAQLVVDIREKFPDADQDEAFKVAADAIMDEIVPNGIRLESVTVLDLESLPVLGALLGSEEIDVKRRAGVKKLGPEYLPAIEGEASYELAKGLKRLLEMLLNKQYWPSADCPTILGQSFLATYENDFERLKGQYGKSIEKLASRMAAYESTVEEKRVSVFRM